MDLEIWTEIKDDDESKGKESRDSVRSDVCVLTETKKKSTENQVRSWEEIDEQMMTLEIQIKDGSNHCNICTGEDTERQCKEDFYEKMNNVLANIKANKERTQPVWYRYEQRISEDR
ncbi:hypothetical protein Trydic_g399 [Trypoxylus dichotomus]